MNIVILDSSHTESVLDPVQCYVNPHYDHYANPLELSIGVSVGISFRSELHTGVISDRELFYLSFFPFVSSAGGHITSLADNLVFG